MLVAIAACPGLQLLLTYAPFMNTLFDTEPLSLGSWAPCLGVGLGIFAAEEAEKAIVRHRAGARQEQVGA